MTEILRTPDECFDDLPDYPFAPHYYETGSSPKLRIHYLDEGLRDGPVVLLMHGQPSWSYLYRFMIPHLVKAGARVLAPDLVGFGKSDKPADRDAYTYENHVSWISEWFTALELQHVHLFCQDWGGLIGLRLVAAMPDRFAGVLASNTGLPTGQGRTPEAFTKWLEFSQKIPVLPIGGILQGATVRELTEKEVAAYDAPFPEEHYKAGARAFPALVPITEQHASASENKEAWKHLAGFDRPFLTAFSDHDPITKSGERLFKEKVAGAVDQPHKIIEQGGHFVQEDQPEALSVLLVEMLRRSGQL